ncbi:hypothetical protein J4E85_007315 [Alternaria conjuncta]|uniref:uncharacterized protein n=1 Tax=Alternaria conjuncta TaxID=181017 RepID=UPI0022210610|nr:uncharacterized protein J4E85_007315 [Alternaria conjuncta]KAI4925436.1 hypothetical protein J4E85_007315 [Alternaria conjuncta]
MHLPKAFILGTFAAPVLSSPSTPPAPPHDTNTTTLVRRGDQCNTAQQHYPDVPEWEKAMRQFCSIHGSNPIFSDSATVFTYTITGHDGKPIDWIFKVNIDNEFAHHLWSWIPLTQECLDGFMALAKGEGGGVGRSWCYWKARTSQDDSVGFLGGKWTQHLPKENQPDGYITWESRARKGQKGI